MLASEWSDLSNFVSSSTASACHTSSRSVSHCVNDSTAAPSPDLALVYLEIIMKEVGTSIRPKRATLQPKLSTKNEQRESSGASAGSAGAQLHMLASEWSDLSNFVSSSTASACRTSSRSVSHCVNDSTAVPSPDLALVYLEIIMKEVGTSNSDQACPKNEQPSNESCQQGTSNTHPPVHQLVVHELSSTCLLQSGVICRISSHQAPLRHATQVADQFLTVSTTARLHRLQI